MKDPSDTIMNQTRDLLVCNAVISDIKFNICTSYLEGPEFNHQSDLRADLLLPCAKNKIRIVKNNNPQ
jgi:hypothetical protein